MLLLLFICLINRIGAKIVVTMVITIVTPNIVASITPVAKPIPPIINATSPLGIMPTPITHELFLLKPTSNAGTPEPINLLIIPKIVKTKAKRSVLVN